VPILINVDELKPGMRLGNNVVNKYSVLLPQGHILTEKDITSLGRLIPDKKVHITDPSLDDFVDFDDVTHAQTVSQVIREKSASVLDKVGTIVKEGKSLTSANVNEMKDVIKQSIDYLTDNSITMALVEQSRDWEDYLQEHSSNVFYLSLLIGNKIYNYVKNERERLSAASHIHNVKDLRPLGTAAMFHDLGMVPLAYLYLKQEPLTDMEKHALRLHPHTGADMLPESISPIVRLSIRQHHENNKGTGYPEGLTGNAINIFSRIIRIADAFCSATADNVGYKGRLEALVLYDMLYGDCKEFYDQELLKVFNTLVPPFPIGAKLKLQDGRYAVVVHHNEDSPFCPEVIVAFDEFGQRLGNEQIEPNFNLGDREDIRLDSFAGEDLSFLNDRLYGHSSRQTYEKVLNFSFP